MIAPILAALVPFIAALAPVLAQWILRRWAAQADPGQQNAKRYEQIDKDIAGQNSQGALAHSSSDLDELERLERVHDQSAGHP
jgi:hypothetical protein